MEQDSTEAKRPMSIIRTGALNHTKTKTLADMTRIITPCRRGSLMSKKKKIIIFMK